MSLPAILALGCVILACASRQGNAGFEPPSGPGAIRVYDPTEAYSSLGMLAAAEPVPFAAGLRFLADAQPDSTVVLLGLSLESSALWFRRIGSNFEAGYRVDILCARDDSILVEEAVYETVRVARFSETRRQDESIVFQTFFRLPPGVAAVTVSVTDLHRGDTSRARLQVVVPDYGMGSVALGLVPVYEGHARSSTAANPELVMNPRVFAVYDADTLHFYVERYGPPGLHIAAVSAATVPGTVLWQDTVALVPAGPGLATGFAHIPADRMLVGTVQVEVEQVGSPFSVHANAVVGISSDWPVADFEEVLSLLRFFGDSQSRDRLREATAAELPHRWGEFWEETDPDRSTGVNEALSGYLENLEVATARFSEPGRPGWLTERGEVFLTLGRPDAVRDVQEDTALGGQQLIRWDYGSEDLVLYFVSEGGRGVFRLTPASRVEYYDAVRRRERTDGG